MSTNTQAFLITLFLFIVGVAYIAYPTNEPTPTEPVYIETLSEITNLENPTFYIVKADSEIVVVSDAVTNEIISVHTDSDTIEVVDSQLITSFAKSKTITFEGNGIWDDVYVIPKDSIKTVEF